MALVMTWLLLASSASVCWDIYSIDNRMDKWEKNHPGQRYIRNYRKLTGTVMKWGRKAARTRAVAR